MDEYSDYAVGFMTKGEGGKFSITRVVLRPKVVFGGEKPTQEQIDRLHHQTHQQCFIANSVRAEIVVESPEHGSR